MAQAVRCFIDIEAWIDDHESSGGETDEFNPSSFDLEWCICAVNSF